MKRLFLLILIPVFLFCGCGDSSPKTRLTREEYKTALRAAWDEFNGGTADYVRAAMSAGEDFAKYKAQSSILQAACDRMYKGLKQFEEIVPPEEFEEKHKKLLKGAEDEKRWTSYREDSFKTDSGEESDRILDKLAEEVNSMPLEDMFPHIFMELYTELGGFDNP